MAQQGGDPRNGEETTLMRVRGAIHRRAPNADTHIDSAMLLSYAEGRLPTEQVAYVDRHLMLCADSSCHRLLASHLRPKLGPASLVQHWLRAVLRQPMWTLPALCAAAFALILLMRGTQLQSSLPRYVAQVQGQEQSWLDAGAKPMLEPLVFSADSVIEVTLRPQQQVRGEVEMRMFLAQTEDVAEPAPAASMFLRETDAIDDIALSESLERGASGAIHLQRNVGELFGRRSGRFHLLIGVGRRGALPTSKLRELARSVDPGGVGTEEGGWQWFRWTLKLRKD